MHKIRFFRILLPVLLALLGVVLWLSWKPRSTPAPPRNTPVVGEAPRAKNLRVFQFEGSSAAIAGNADVFEPSEDGSLHLEGIRDLEIERDDREPLIVSALRGDRHGTEGEQRWKFEEEVVFREEEAGLTLRLPSLEVDQEAGEARSSGDIRFEAPNLRGSAEALVYSLTGEPGSLTRPVFEEDGDGRVTADSAVLLDSIRDVELEGNVRAERGGQRLDAGRLRLIRDRILRSASAGNGVKGGWTVPDGAPVSFEADTLDVKWDDQGAPSSFMAKGHALVRHGTDSIAATTLSAERRTEGEIVWHVDAEESVYVQGQFGAAPGLLRAERVSAGLDASQIVRRAEAVGRVTYEGRDVRAEAVRALYATHAGPALGEIRLFGDERRKARLAQGDTRVAAESIQTDTRGERLEAQGRVEATLLPDDGSEGAADRVRMFVASEAVHFVSDRLDSSGAGAKLVFTGSVRGWQGERNLAAKTIVVDQTTKTLGAWENVTTRFPREQGEATVSEADYIQIIADRLDYDDAGGLAVYQGDVRVRFSEGWLEAERVEVELGGEERRIHEVRAFGTVQLEVHRTSEGEMPRPMAGSSDRLVYSPPNSTLRLFGEQTPASVRRIGDGGGTTTGRVLTYRMDTGTLDVDSGEQGPGRIVTPETE